MYLFLFLACGTTVQEALHFAYHTMIAAETQVYYLSIANLAFAFSRFDLLLLIHKIDHFKSFLT